MKKRKAISILIFVVMIALAILYGYIRLYYFVPSKSIFYFLPYTGLTALLVAFIIFLFKKNAKILILPIIFLAFLLIAYVTSANVMKLDYDKAFADGTKIGEAVEKYHIDKGIYPKKLSDLIPKYLNEIPTIETIWNHNDFVYYVENGGETYFLGFESYYFDGKGWLQYE